MPGYHDTRNIEIEATPADCFSVITDYEQMTDWQSRVCKNRG